MERNRVERNRAARRGSETAMIAGSHFRDETTPNFSGAIHLQLACLGRRAWWALAALIPVAFLFAPGCAGTKVESASRNAESVPVTVAKVEQKAVPMDITVIGNVEAYATISVKAHIGGELVKAYFQEGDFVKQGDMLFQIDPRPYEAALKLAQANLARDTAQASLAEANLAKD